MKSRDFFIFTLLVALTAAYFLGPQILGMPYLIFRTLVRMLAAYALSLLFSISVGIYIAHNKRAFEIVFPLLDILQSIPVLGFLPFAVLFIIHAIPVFGSEFATIFLIFTSMTWSIIFNVIEGVRAIPSDIQDVARLNRMSGPDYLFHILLPAIYGPVVSGSIVGWGGGWYFLVAGEYITFGKEPPYVLPGVGSFIAQSAYAGDILHSILGMGILAVLVLFMNTFIWAPLVGRAGRLSYMQNSSSLEYAGSQENAITRLLNRAYAGIRSAIVRLFRRPSVQLMNRLEVVPRSVSFEERKGFSVYEFAIVTAVAVLFGSIFLLAGKPVSELGTMAVFTLKTLGRIFIAYIIAVLWTVGLAMYIGRNKKLLDVLLPIFDVAQSIPAIAVFPIIVVFVIRLVGGESGIEIASILLLLTGMQWYLLFNVIRAMRALPNDIVEASQMLGLKMADKVKHIFIPAILPTFVIGSMQAIGGGWNATIISEYIQYQHQTFHADGIGYLLDLAAVNADSVAIILNVLVMVGIIIFLNKFIWRNLLKRADLYKF